MCEPKCGWKGGVAGSQPMSTAVHRSANKLWRSNSICTAPNGKEKRPFFELITMIFTFGQDSRTGTYPDDALELFSLLAQQFWLAHSASLVSVSASHKITSWKRILKNYYQSVLRIRIPMFLGLQNPDTLVRGTDPDPSITKQNSKKNLDSYCFWLLYDFLSLKNHLNVRTFKE